SDYGSGAVMAVPAHDDRDFEFAKEYELPIKSVISPGTPEAAYTDKYEGTLINSGAFNGLNPVEAREKITQFMEGEGIGQNTVNFRLREWCLSRQRYWGCPIPIIYCDDGSIETVPEDQLPVLHPTDVTFSGNGNPLETSPTFMNVVDSKGRPARRET